MLGQAYQLCASNLLSSRVSFSLIEALRILGDMGINSKQRKKKSLLFIMLLIKKIIAGNSDLCVLYRERMSGGENTIYRKDGTDLYIYQVKFKVWQYLNVLTRALLFIFPKILDQSNKQVYRPTESVEVSRKVVQEHAF